MWLCCHIALLFNVSFGLHDLRRSGLDHPGA